MTQGRFAVSGHTSNRPLTGSHRASNLIHVSNELPPLPEGFRWRPRMKRAWKFADMQRKTWYGWKTIQTYDFYDLVDRFYFFGSTWA